MYQRRLLHSNILTFEIITIKTHLQHISILKLHYIFHKHLGLLTHL